MPYNLRLAVIITNPIIIEGGVGADFAWSAFGLIGFRFGLFGEDNARVFAGYRALFQDYTDGSGRETSSSGT